MCTALTQIHGTSWWRNLDNLVTSEDADWIRWASRALGKVLRFQVYLLLGTKVEPVCADLRDSFQIKGQCCPLWETVELESLGLICCVQHAQLLLFSPMLQVCPYMPLTGVKALEESLETGCQRGSRHLQLSPSQTLVHQHLCCAAQQLSPASPPSLLPLLPVHQLCCNLGTEMWSQRCFLGNKDNLFWGRLLSS